MEKETQRPTVLVVEDEPLILMDALDIIEEAGFAAIGAQNADEAIVILESRDDIQIIFTDIDMPGSMNGLKLAEAVRGRWPPINILITSGRPLPDPSQFPVGIKFLAKPHNPAVILKMLHEFAA